ncbi:unnamed protein product [Litomosoides sigmodontis]|uniref:Cleavage and polyadenylation specificity factor subunit 5 n=1 Tax=Litomosoides sigmodontis TaxID=42156 RepID=A0A3P6SBQ8_LITSI|nr:unnamed protein product [Litomosoides sigmodontis]
MFNVDNFQSYSYRRETESLSSVVKLYPLHNYSVRNSDREDPPRLCEYRQSLKLREDFENDGLIRTVQAVLMGHQNSIVHVLLLKNGAGQTEWSKLPTLTLYPGEDEIHGMKRLLMKVMGFQNESAEAICRVYHVVSKWWRPNFDSCIYPYIPSHITKPKEMIKLFAVDLPKYASFTIAKNSLLIAAPLFEIYDNTHEYGPIIASLPHALSRSVLHLQSILFT